MRVRFWGTRGTRPTPGVRTIRYGGNTACVEVRTKNNELVIVDAGSGIAELGTTLRQEAPLTAHVLITHTHWDHIQGFPYFGPNFLPTTRLTVIGPHGSMKSLQSAFADQMDPTYFPLRMDEMPAQIEFVEVGPSTAFDIAGLRITTHEMHHPIATFGYRIEEEGAAFVFATDNESHLDLAANLAPAAKQLAWAAHDALVEWAAGAELLVHDAQYSWPEYQRHMGWGHSTFDYAVQVAEGAKARQLAFFHHDPEHSDNEIDALVEQALTAAQERGGVHLLAFGAAENHEIMVAAGVDTAGSGEAAPEAQATAH